MLCGPVCCSRLLVWAVGNDRALWVLGRQPLGVGCVTVFLACSWRACAPYPVSHTPYPVPVDNQNDPDTFYRTAREWTLLYATGADPSPDDATAATALPETGTTHSTTSTSGGGSGVASDGPEEG